MVTIPLHPDDLLFFNEVADVIRRVAKHYELPLNAVEAMPMPTKAMADKLGDCNSSGTIRLVMRATVDGEFVDAPRSPERVWQTAAHELAHLRHMNHGKEFELFFIEMHQAVTNFRVDHRQKVLDRLVKMQRSRDGEAAIGNVAAAQAFAEAINRMLIEHELEPSAIDHATATDKDPVIQVKTNLSAYRIADKKRRIAWQESLARIVANAHLCKFLIRTGSNDIYFVGTKAHATVAEYVFGTLVKAASDMCDKAYHDYGSESIAKIGRWKAETRGFREAWFSAFVLRIQERLKEARTAAVAAVPEVARPGALMRLDGALVKAQTYIDDKFKTTRSAPSLVLFTSGHVEGRIRGRAAADSMPIGRRGVTGASQKLLGS